MNLYNQYILALFLTASTALALAIFVFFQRIRSDIKFSFTFYCLCLCAWGSGQLLALNEKNQILSTIFVRNYCHTGVIFIPILLLHFVFSVLNKVHQKKRFLIACYAVGVIFAILNNFTDLIVKGVATYPPIFGYVYLPGLLHPLMVSLFVLLAVYGNVLLYRGYRDSSGSKRMQLKYLFLATLLSYIGGPPNFLLGYRIQIPFLMPFGTYVMPAYAGILAYAILRHHLMEIRLALTKATIFFIVYAFTLTFPFWVGYHTKSWFITGAIMAILALGGPIAHRRLQKKAEAILQKEQLAMRRALREFAGQVTQIKDFDTLYKETLNKTYEIVKPEFAGLYVYSEKQSYVLQHDLSDKEYPVYTEFMANHNLMIAMAQDRKPVFLETVKGMPQMLHESIALPFYEGFKQKGVLCFLLLGPKKNKALYDHMDLDLFEILEAQVSLALENLSLLQDREFRILEEQRLSKMVIIGDIGTGVAHQVNNRFNSMLTLLRMHFDLYKETDLNLLSCEQLRERYAAALSDMKDIHDESLNGFKIAEAMLASAREPIDPQPFKIEYALHLALDLLRAKKNLKRITIVEDIPHNSPCVWASTACTQDVFYNLVDNGADADEDKIHSVASGKLKSEEDNYQPKVIIRTRVVEDNLMLVEVEDNGIGIEEKHMESVGQPCYSTKAGKKMGTGYGVATVKKLLAQSGSKLEIRSTYGKGSVFSFTLPLATREQIEEHEKQKPKKD